jgi:hypothetical protein
LGAHQIGYELEEELGWAVTEEELYARLNEAKAKGLLVKGLALINPGTLRISVASWLCHGYMNANSRILFDPFR